MPGADIYHPLFRRVVAASLGAKSTILKIAGSYAREGLRMHDPDELRIQALYVRSNLNTWRGAEAKATRAALDEVLE